MGLDGINKKLLTSEKFQKIVNYLNNNEKVNISGLVNSSKANVLYGIYKVLNKSIFVITSNNLEAKNIYEDLKFYTDDCIYFQGRENASIL